MGKFTCCREDDSLVVSNYSDATCSTSPDAQFRISADYNGQCAVIGNNEDMIDGDDKITHYAENAKDTYVFIMKWACNEYEASCDDIPVISDELLPNVCSDECVENEARQEEASNRGKEIDDDGFGKEDDGAKQHVGVEAVVIAVFVLMFVFIIVYWAVCGRKRAMD